MKNSKKNLYNSIIKDVSKIVMKHLNESEDRTPKRKSTSKHINEMGDTFAGQYMMGRASARANRRGDSRTEYDMFNGARKQRKFDKFRNSDMNDAFFKGYDDEGALQDETGNDLKYRQKSTIRNNYEYYKSIDNDNIQKDFINWMLKDDLALQLAVEYKRDDSDDAFSDLLSRWNDYRDYSASVQTIKEIDKAINEWWYYNQEQFTEDDEY